MRSTDHVAQIRPESHDDYPVIHELVREAFGREAVAELVERIRSSANYVPELALVATRDEALVGHTMLSYVGLANAEVRHRVLTLSPVSVAPGAQRQGIGSALITTAIEKADQKGEPLIVLEGSPQYYPRFGFRPSIEFDIRIHLPDWAPEEAAMVLPLSRYDASVRGDVVYPTAFDLVTADRA
ncbi:MAG TPA: N-acetyltransferase [Gaiellaceae bacterium]